MSGGKEPTIRIACDAWARLEQNGDIAAASSTPPGNSLAMAPHRRAGRAGAGVFEFPVVGTGGAAVVEALERLERRHL